MCDNVIDTEIPLALRAQAILVHGISRIQNRKSYYFLQHAIGFKVSVQVFKDATKAKNNVDLPLNKRIAKTSAITAPNPTDLDFNIDEIVDIEDIKEFNFEIEDFNRYLQDEYDLDKNLSIEASFPTFEFSQPGRDYELNRPTRRTEGASVSSSSKFGSQSSSRYDDDDEMIDIVDKDQNLQFDIFDEETNKSDVKHVNGNRIVPEDERLNHDVDDTQYGLHDNNLDEEDRQVISELDSELQSMQESTDMTPEKKNSQRSRRKRKVAEIDEIIEIPSAEIRRQLSDTSSIRTKRPAAKKTRISSKRRKQNSEWTQFPYLFNNTDSKLVTTLRKKISEKIIEQQKKKFEEAKLSQSMSYEPIRGEDMVTFDDIFPEYSDRDTQGHFSHSGDTSNPDVEMPRDRYSAEDPLTRPPPTSFLGIELTEESVGRESLGFDRLSFDHRLSIGSRNTQSPSESNYSSENKQNFRENRMTSIFRNVLQNEFDKIEMNNLKDEVLFSKLLDEVVKNPGPSEVVRSFMQLLVLRSAGEISAEQHEPYGDIFVRKAINWSANL
eukprot:jgi/Bigna1/72831/fgenesh1_pg.21_\